MLSGCTPAQLADASVGDPLDQLGRTPATAADAAADDSFGYSVSVAGDTAVIGASGTMMPAATPARPMSSRALPAPGRSRRS